MIATAQQTDVTDTELFHYHEPIAFIENNFVVRAGKEQRIVPFILNPIQRSYAEKRKYRKIPGVGGRNLVNKARQIGVSTIIMALYLHNTITREATSTVIVGHDDEAMEKLLNNCRTMIENLPDKIRPPTKYDNKGELYFNDRDSRIYISTYKKLKIRSQTVNNLLLTEVAFWKARDIDTLIAGMIGSVPDNGDITIESTPNGVGNLFWRTVQAAQDGDTPYRYFEYPWFLNTWEYVLPRDRWDELPMSLRPAGADLGLDEEEIRLATEWNVTPEQIMWRRARMAEFNDMRVDTEGVRRSRMFDQEYGCDFIHSGSTFFDPAYLVPRCHFRDPIPGHRHVHGVDTAEGLPNGHFNALVTIDLDTGEIINVIRNRHKPDVFAVECHEWMMRCDRGVVGVEQNNTGHAVLVVLAQLWNAAASQLGRVKMPYRIYGDDRRMGFLSGTRSREVALIDAEKALREKSVLLPMEGRVLMVELGGFECDSLGNKKPPPGGNDDTVFALAWAVQTMKHHSFFWRERKSGGSAKTF